MKTVRIEAKIPVIETGKTKIRYTIGMSVPVNTKSQAYIGKKLREIRERKGKSQKEVADDIGIDISYYAGIERGEKNPTFSVLEQICKVLGVRSSEILPF